MFVKPLELNLKVYTFILIASFQCLCGGVQRQNYKKLFTAQILVASTKPGSLLLLWFKTMQIQNMQFFRSCLHSYNYMISSKLISLVTESQRKLYIFCSHPLTCLLPWSLWITRFHFPNLENRNCTLTWFSSYLGNHSYCIAWSGLVSLHPQISTGVSFLY